MFTTEGSESAEGGSFSCEGVGKQFVQVRSPHPRFLGAPRSCPLPKGEEKLERSDN